ncbi:MAG: hypothetical protein ACT4PE_14945 [Candidatus Eiseniibacteriota bacterium]
MMGVYGWAKLKIGGNVSKRALREALAIHEIDVDEALKSGDYEGQGLEAYLDEDHLVVEHDQASYAQFTDLEAALVTAGIAFDRLSDAVAEYGESVRFFRPGLAKPYDAASEGYEPMVPVGEVRRRLADGLDALQRWLDQEYPAIPELERLEIVEDEPATTN